MILFRTSQTNDLCLPPPSKKKMSSDHSSISDDSRDGLVGGKRKRGVSPLKEEEVIDYGNT